MSIGPGALIAGRYELGRQLGAGGMARVYLARDRMLGRDVAVKVLAERYAADPAFVERFRREATSAALLNHPNIVAVYDRGEVNGSYFIVMEHLPGPDLKRVVRERGPLPPLEAIDVCLQLLAALGAAHRRDVIHRDVKPQNVMFTDDGRVKVTDFGIARAGGAQITEVGLIIGTAQYLSPEQAQGYDVTPASDCYSAGIVLYEMLTGRVPFDGERPVTVALKQVSEAAPDPRTIVPSIPAGLAEVVLRALEKDPADRYMHAEDFARALQLARAEIAGEGETALLGGATSATRVIPAAVGDDRTRVIGEREPVTRPTPPARAAPPRGGGPPPAAARRRRRRWPLAVLALVVLAVAGGVAAFLLRGPAGSVTVPSQLEGATRGFAEHAITAAHLEPRTKLTPSADVVKGLVVGTQPPGGTTVDRGSSVTILVSSGPKLVTLPDVTGKQRQQALATLRAAGFTNPAPKVVQAFNPDPTTIGQVVSQDPVGSQRVAPDTQVTITISKGPQKVAMPDLRKKSVAQATALLTAANLKLGTQTPRPDGNYSPGTVLRQSIAPNASVAEGTTVDIVVAEAPQKSVPDGLVGLTPAAARTKLDQSGYRDNPLISVAGTATSPDQIGTIVDVSPSAGTPIGNTDPITITVGVAPGGTGTAGTVGTVGTGTTGQAPPAPGGNVQGSG